MWVGGGSGANTPPYVVDPFQAFTARARQDGTYLAWDFVSASPIVDQSSDACIVFINAFSTEGEDRPGLSDAYSDNIINTVASQCSNTSKFYPIPARALRFESLQGCQESTLDRLATQPPIANL